VFTGWGSGEPGGWRARVTTDNLRAELRAALAAEFGGAVLLRHELHTSPELSGSETWTAARMAAELGDPEAPAVSGTGRLIRIGPPTGPCIAVRAELDALPLTERTGAPWASQNGAMHACGHDVHLAALAALGRAARSVSLPAALLAVLQPREETFPSGARDVVAAGAFAAELVSAVVGVHLQHQVPAGTAAAAAGTVNAATDDFEIVVEGAGGHAGYPHQALDPVPALCQTVLAAQQIIGRRTDPTHAVVVSVGILEAGHAANIIPGTARARGSLRALNEADRPEMHKILNEIVEHTCRAHGCRGSVTIVEGEPALVNDTELATASWPWLRQAGFTVDTEFRSCGADDFSFYTRSAPTLMIFVGSGGRFSLHHPQFLPSDKAVRQVAEAMLAGYLGALARL
jgi:amidohydrolase